MRKIAQNLTLILIAALSHACLQNEAATKKSALAQTCVLAEDQLSSLSGRWRSIPIPVAFREDQFTAEEMAQIVFSVNVWNQFFLKVHKVALFDIGTAEHPRMSNLNRSLTLCSKPIIDSAGTFTGEVVIFKNAKWPYSNAKSAIAFTQHCRKSVPAIREINTAIIDLNYEDFFASGKPQPDLVTNVVHELGHVAGLDHSCNSKSEDNANFVGCGSVSNQEYIDAVMYPYDASSAGQTRRTLQKNDQERSNCLYGGTAYPWDL